MCRLKNHAYAGLPPSENHASQGKNVHTNTRNSAFPRALKLIAKNKVFECLTLLKIEVIEYGKWASKWLEMHSQRHRFSFFSGGGPTPALILFPHLWPAPISSKLRLSAFSHPLAKIMRPREKNVHTNTRNSAFPRALKLIAKNKVFECLTLLKIEVIEYGKWASK